MPTSQLGTCSSMLGDMELGLPNELPPPAIRNIPLLRRVPDTERRLGNFSEVLSNIVNSLARSGQLIQISPGEFRIIISEETVRILPGTEPPASSFYGQLWVDVDGNLHYIDTNGIDYQLTPPTASNVIDFLSGVGDPAPALGELDFHYYDTRSGALWKKE